jgi:Fic family protein
MVNTDAIQITPQMLGIISELDEFKGRWQMLNKKHIPRLQSLKKISTIETIGSSNRIEGNKLSDAEIEALLSGVGRTSFKSRDEAEVAGYADLMNTIFENYDLISLSENYIKQLHKILLQYVDKDTAHRGEYKKLSNTVAAYDADGQEVGIVFETAAPFDTPRLMEDLVNWVRDNLSEPFYHPLIVIGIFVVVFLAIHPFQDGNGRLSRALTTLLLLKSGYTYVPYSSLESIIEASKDSYYRALNKTQRTLKIGAAYDPWLEFFLSSLQKQKRHLESKLQGGPSVDARLSRLAEQIVRLAQRQEQITVQDVARELGANSNTAKKAVKSLVDSGYLIKHGATRGAWYVLAG